MKIRIGTRKSKLALWQTRFVADQLKRSHPDVEVEEVHIITQGDRILDKPLAQIGDKGLFTQELENQLLSGEIDMAVHSLKDLPTALPAGLGIGAIMERVDPRDVLLSRSGQVFQGLPAGAVVGTSSLRRAAQVRHLRPDLTVTDIRGNVDTRIRKLDDGQYDAIILAHAGLLRLGLDDRVTTVLDEWFYAVGQGALAIETKSGNDRVEPFLQSLRHDRTTQEVRAERSFLRTLEGGCHVPIGVRTNWQDDQLSLSGMIASVDGTQVITDTISGQANDAEALGKALAEKMKQNGGSRILGDSVTGNE